MLRRVGGESKIGLVLGTYRLDRLIGEGGMGWVYEASHTILPRKVAIKLLNPRMLDNREVVERFHQEAQLASGLGSEHIISVHDLGWAHDGAPYMVMELLRGESLHGRLRRLGRMTVSEVARLLDQLSRALDIAHTQGVVHRDLKPENIFLCSDRSQPDFVKVLDFGISKVLSAEVGGGTKTGVVMGTPRYMSPEQVNGEVREIDTRTDIFAVGTILYECLSGRDAFTSNLPMLQHIHEICTVEPPPIRQAAPDVPEAIEQVVRQAMAKHKANRYDSILLMRRAFYDAAAIPAPVMDDPTRRASDKLVLVATPPPMARPTTLSGSASEVQGATGPVIRNLRVPGARPRGRIVAALATAAVVVGVVVALLVLRKPRGQVAVTAADASLALAVVGAQVPLASLAGPSADAATPRVPRQVVVEVGADGYAVDGTARSPLELGVMLREWAQSEPDVRVTVKAAPGVAVAALEVVVNSAKTAGLRHVSVEQPTAAVPSSPPSTQGKRHPKTKNGKGLIIEELP